VTCSSRQHGRLPLSRKAAAEEARIREGRWTDSAAGKITVGEWIDRWLEVQDVGISIQDSREYQIRRFLRPAWNATPLASISRWENALPRPARRSRRTARDARPHQPATLTELQALPGAFTSTYNTRRPHRSLPYRATPATAYAARPKAAPRGPDRRHPRPRPHRPHRHRREAHPPRQRETPPHRHRPRARPHLGPHAHPGPGRPHHQRRHRRADPGTRHQPRQELPANRPTTRTQPKRPRTH
jgi:hypothetical protein